MSIDSRAKLYGKVFGDWTIRERIGQGSNGKTAVFRLSRNNLTYEENCAMKIVNIIEQRGQYSQMSDSFKNDYREQCNHLCQEAEHEVRLMYTMRGSGNIVNYLDYHFEEWQDESGYGTDLLIRMDYLDNLGEKIRSTVLEEDEIIRIGKDICKALVACHSSDILHRDIKPENIFYNQYQIYLLGDFGISKMIDNAQSAETRTGTSSYAAPEQFVGDYDYRVDIYSLGLTLYQLANNNRLPFADTFFVRPQDIQLRLNGKNLPRPEKVSEKLAEVILRACAFQPQDRYQSAEEFLKALEIISLNSNINVKKDLYATEPALEVPTKPKDESKETSAEDLYATEPALEVPTKPKDEPKETPAEDLYATEPAPEVPTEPKDEPKERSKEDLYATESALEVPTKPKDEPKETPAEDLYATELALEVPKMTIKDSEEVPGKEDNIAESASNLSGKVDIMAPIENAEIKINKPSQEEELNVYGIDYLEQNVDFLAVGREYYESKQYKKAVEWYRKGIEAGNHDVLYELALCYMNGYGVQQDDQTAINMLEYFIDRTMDPWLRALAKYRLGQLYERNETIKKHNKIAEKWYRESANEGNPYAQKRFRNGKFLKA